MDRVDILPARVRSVVIATGVVSATALFPILYLLYPALLIAGGYIQPRFPTTGKWFVWVGAVNLGPIVVVYDVMMLQDFRHQTRSPEYALSAFSGTTILLLWCYVELAVDGLRRFRAYRSMPPVPRPISYGLWIVAAALNLLLGRWIAGFAKAPSLLSSGSLYPLIMSLVQLATILAFDIFLVVRIVTLRRSRRTSLRVS
jgi:hypothetical protein